MKIFWHIFVLATVLDTFSKNWENFSKSSGHPVVDASSTSIPCLWLPNGWASENIVYFSNMSTS